MVASWFRRTKQTQQLFSRRIKRTTVFYGAPLVRIDRGKAGRSAPRVGSFHFPHRERHSVHRGFLGLSSDPLAGIIVPLPQLGRQAVILCLCGNGAGIMRAGIFTPSPEEETLVAKICTFIAQHLRVDLDSISIDSHFRDDLGLDLLDTVELTILIEKEFVNREVADASEEIEFVGDLIHHIEAHQPG